MNNTEHPFKTAGLCHLLSLHKKNPRLQRKNKQSYSIAWIVLLLGNTTLLLLTNPIMTLGQYAVQDDSFYGNDWFINHTNILTRQLEPLNLDQTTPMGLPLRNLHRLIFIL